MKLSSSLVEKGYKDVLRSTSVIAGASVINILIGLVRTKAAAMLLGPTGLGMIGLLQSLMSSATTVFALGLGTAGTRQIADAYGNHRTAQLAQVRRALVWGMLGLGIIGALTLWLLRATIAEYLLNDMNSANAVGWLAIGVMLTVASGSQGALLRGMRRIEDNARLVIFSSAISTVLGTLALWIWGSDGVLIYILAVPLISYGFGHWYVSRLDKFKSSNFKLSGFISEWRALAVVGTSFMLTAVVIAGSHFAVRSIIKNKLGLESLGLFQAAWMITVTYVAFVIGAMSNDYYPRLSAIIEKHGEVNQTINQQIEITLLLSVPILLFMQSLSPLMIDILYSPEFKPAVSILRWQVLGDAFKIACWPLGLVALAANDSKTYMYTESLASFIFIGIIWLALSTIGIEAAGIAYLCMYVVYFPVVLRQARTRTKFNYTPAVRQLTIIALGMSLATFLLAQWSALVGGIAGSLFGLTMSIYSLGRMWRTSRFGGMAGELGRSCEALLSKVRL